MNRIRHNFKVKGKNVKGWKEQAATIDPSTKIENKNEKLELGTCGINDPWFYREVRCESGAVTQLY